MIRYYSLIFDVDDGMQKTTCTMYEDCDGGSDVREIARTTFGPFDMAGDFWKWFSRVLGAHPIFLVK